MKTTKTGGPFKVLLLDVSTDILPDADGRCSWEGARAKVLDYLRALEATVDRLKEALEEAVDYDDYRSRVGLLR